MIHQVANIMAHLRVKYKKFGNFGEWASQLEGPRRAEWGSKLRSRALRVHEPQSRTFTGGN